MTYLQVLPHLVSTHKLSIFGNWNWLQTTYFRVCGWARNQLHTPTQIEIFHDTKCYPHDRHTYYSALVRKRRWVYIAIATTGMPILYVNSTGVRTLVPWLILIHNLSDGVTTIPPPHDSYQLANETIRSQFCSSASLIHFTRRVLLWAGPRKRLWNTCRCNNCGVRRLWFVPASPFALCLRTNTVTIIYSPTTDSRSDLLACPLALETQNQVELD